MALHRPGSSSTQAGAASSDHKSHPTARPSSVSKNADGYGRNGTKQVRGRKAGRSVRSRQCVLGLLSFLLLLVVVVTLLGGDYLVSVGNINHSRRSPQFLDNAGYAFLLPFWFYNHGLVVRPYTNRKSATDKGNWNDPDDSTGNALFGKISISKEELMRDSRDWDKDDRERGMHDYEENPQLTEQAEDDNGEDLLINEDKQVSYTHNLTFKQNKGMEASQNNNFVQISEFLNTQGKDGGWRGGLTKEMHGGLYNEKGREELKLYEENFKRELEIDKEKYGSVHPTRQRQKIADGFFDGDNKQTRVSTWKLGDEKSYSHAKTVQLTWEGKKGTDKSYINQNENKDDYDTNGGDEYEEFAESGSDVLYDHQSKNSRDKNSDRIIDRTNDHGQSSPFEQDGKNIGKGRFQSAEERKTFRKNTKTRKRAGLACDVNFRNSMKGLREAGYNLNFSKFSLKYIELEDKPKGTLRWEPHFAGHQLLEEREESFKAKDQAIHCGFIRASDGLSTGFNLTQEDTEFLESCRIAVSSCIFGNSDNIRSPRGKKFTGPFKKEVCFVMFVDKHTLEVMIQEGQRPDAEGYVGLWKIVVIKNLPYLDARRNGKIPKFLTHRLFPAARYSIWLDSKLRLQSDPVLILEYFLWRGGYEYAISNHYDRHCVWEEVQQNKKLNKFNHTMIDEQFAFYQADGLTKFNASDPNSLLPSYVPEGSFIVRAHTPMSNLFSCLWFNEVDRFTPRDQLSFAYTYLKLVRMNPDKYFHLNMFKDCERKAVAKLFQHRKNSTSQLQRHEEHSVG